MEKIKLIEMAVYEWLDGKLSGEEAMNNISVTLNICNPSPESIKWAKQSISNLNKESPCSKK